MAPASASTTARPNDDTTNLVVNGSFEDPSTWQTNAVDEYSSGSTDLTGWTVGGDSVDVTGSTYWSAEDGDQSLDLAGSAPGSVSQTVATTPDAVYTLTWYMAGNTNCGQSIKTMDVSWDGSLVYAPTFDTEGFDNDSMGWTEEQVEVAATGTTSTLEFADATLDNSQCGSALDDVSLTTAQLATPAFVRDSPPLQTLAGAPYSASFYASGVPVYALVGAPSWLSVTPEGAVVGTPPTGMTSFSYSVSAENIDGSVLAGPYTVAVQAAATATGTVVDGGIAANPVAGTVVQACVPGTDECELTRTGDDGTYSVAIPASGNVVLTGFPLPGSGDTATSTNTLPVPSGGIENETISLDGIAPMPGGLLVNGTDAPTVYWANPSTVSLTGCPNGSAYVTVEGENSATGLRQTDVIPLTETPVGSGTYTGTIPAQEPVHGPVAINDQIFCGAGGQYAVEPYLGAAGDPVIINGSGFTGATAVDFGAVPASSFAVESDTLIEAVVPPGQGDATVTVTTPSGPAALSGSAQFGYFGITGASPASGPAAGGTTVDITGGGFTDVDSVTFGTAEAMAFQVVSDSEIQAVVPPGSGTVGVTVVDGGSETQATAAGVFTYTSDGSGSGGSTARRPASSAPSTKPDADPTLRSTSTSTSASTASANAHAAKAPAAVRPRFLGLDVSDLAGILVNQLSSQIQQAAQQVANEKASKIPKSLLCKSDYSRNVLKEELHSDVTDGLETAALAALLAIARANLSATVGAVLLALEALGPVGVTIVTAVFLFARHEIGVQFNAMLDTYLDPLIDNAINQQCNGNPGEMAMNGTDAFVDPSGTVLDSHGNPISGATVTILRADTASGPFAPLSPADPGIEPNVNPQTTTDDGVFHWDVLAGWYEVQAQAPGCADPADPGSRTVTIGPYPVPPPQVGLTITLACTGEAAPPTPGVTGLGADTGPAAGGTTVPILGTGFTPASTVDFGSSPAAAVTYLSTGELIATAPAGSGLVDVTVHNATASSPTSSADQYFFGSAPTVTGLDTTSGPTAGGTTVILTGTGFTGASAVSFGELPASAFTVLSDTRIQATTPAGQTGTVDVLAATPAGVSATTAADQFTFTGTAPAFTADTPPATATVGQPYTYTYTASGSPAPTFSVSSGSLPPGLSLNAGTGVLSGTPTSSGSFNFTVQAANGTGTPAFSPATSITVATPVGPAIDQQANVAGTTSATAHLSTTTPGDLIVAFVSGDGPSSAKQKAKVTGGGLSWALTQRTNSGYGTAEIWTARATGTLSNAAITSSLTSIGYGLDLTVVAFSHAPAVGQVASAWATKGAPVATLTTTTANSWVFAVGNDWNASIPRVIGANQTLLTQSTDAKGDTYWTQYETLPTPTAGTGVTINDTAPTQDRWNLALVEID